MTWYTDHRMDWIAETLKVFGFINRGHLQRKFDISAPQASNDFRTFQEQNPGLMEYDPRQKNYVPTRKQQQIWLRADRTAKRKQEAKARSGPRSESLTGNQA